MRNVEFADNEPHCVMENLQSNFTEKGKGKMDYDEFFIFDIFNSKGNPVHADYMTHGSHYSIRMLSICTTVIHLGNRRC